MSESYEDYATGENPGDISKEIGVFAERYLRAVDSWSESDEHELFSRLYDKEGKIIEFPVSDLESIEPTDEQATFLVRMKERVGAKEKVAIVAGAALTACVIYVRLRKKNKA